MNKARLLVIFGAGASYDSALDYPPAPNRHSEQIELARPPLAKDLFQHRPQWTETVSRLKEVSQVAARLRPRIQEGFSLEDELQHLDSESGEDPHRLRQLMAIRFYLREILLTVETQWWSEIRGFNNYEALLECFRHEIAAGRLHTPVSLITFNYDTLLDRAFRRSSNLELNLLDSFVKPEEAFNLFKLHGSTEWWRAVSGVATMPNLKGEARYQTLIDYTPRLVLTDTYDIQRTVRPAIAPCAIGDSFAIPALAVPLVRGKQFECPPAHLERLWHEVSRATHILTIGWRGMEQHFLDELNKRLGKYQILSVSGSVDGAKEANGNVIGATGGTRLVGQPRTFEGGFTPFAIESERIREFLKAQS